MAGSRAAVQECSGRHECRPIWAKVKAEVARINAIEDTQKRNQQITADYAKLYLAQPDLKWAGVAAFASKQVGCGMSRVYGMGKVGAAVAGPGNKAVFDELYPPLSFYHEAKAAGFSNDEIKSCLANSPGGKPDQAITRGLDQIMSGNSDAGALTMLKHEQQDTLDKAVYSSWWTRRGLQANEATGGMFASENLVFTQNCRAHGNDPHIDFADYPGHIYDFDSRWPFAQDAAGKFSTLTSNSATAPGISSSLRQLATGQYPSFNVPTPDWGMMVPQ